MSWLGVAFDMRPDEIIMAYWREVTVIEEDADVLAVEYLEAA